MISFFLGFVILTCLVLYGGGWILAVVCFPSTALRWILSPFTWRLQTVIQQVVENIFQAGRISVLGAAQGPITHEDFFSVLV